MKIHRAWSAACCWTLFALLLAVSPARAAVTLLNGSFETIGTQYLNIYGGINEATNWTNLTPVQKISAASFVGANPPNLEGIPNGTGITGSRYMRLVSDYVNSPNNPDYRGATAQLVGTMTAGETYTLKGDIFGTTSTGVPYGAAISFVNQVSLAPSVTYASQTVSDVGNGTFIADGINLSYTATAADNGQPLVVLLLSQASVTQGTAPRGGMDNLRLTTTGASADLTPPTLLSAAAPTSRDSVTLTFDEAVNISGATFSIVGGTVTSATLGSPATTVVLAVTGLTPGSPYTAKADNVKDVAGNVRATASAPFTAGPAPASVALLNGSFESIGAQYLGDLGGLSQPNDWVNLTPTQTINASSAVGTNPPNGEALVGAGLTGSRYLRLASDLVDDPAYRGATAQLVGTMIAGTTYRLKGDVMANSSVGVNYGLTASFVSDVSLVPTAIYASQNLAGIPNGTFLADGIDLTYTATAADHGHPLVVFLLAQGNSSNQTAARGGVDNLRLSTVNDTTPPVLLTAAAPISRDQVTLTFDEPVNIAGATFSIVGGTLQGANLGAAPKTVVLSVTGLTAGAAYTAKADNVKDLAGNVRATATAPFTAGPAPGTVTLVNGSFEAIGAEYEPTLGGLSQVQGWVNLTPFNPRNAASVQGANPPNSESPGGAGVITGDRYLRLGFDPPNNQAYRGAIAQLVGYMSAGKTYSLLGDIFGAAGASVEYGATISFVSEVSNNPSVTYATQTVTGVLPAQILSDGINLSYVATEADEGQPLILLLTAQLNPDNPVAPQGGIDNLRLNGTTPGPDLTPPVLVSATFFSPNLVTLTFNEAVDLSGASFSITGGTVTHFALGSTPRTVVLTVAGLAPGSSYSVTATNVKDTAGNTTTSGMTDFTVPPPPGPAPIELLRPAREPMGPASRRGGIVISEINYHPADRADGANTEFLEVCNTLPWTEDLGGFRITGEVNYTFPAGTSLPSGGYLVVAASPSSMQTVYGLAGVLGPYTGALNNSGGTVRLRDYSDAVIFEVEYDSGHPWQPAADGAGHSLVLARPSYGMNDPRAWDISYELGGSPGAADPYPVDPVPGDPIPADPYRTVMINEVQAATASGADFIELYNYSSLAVDISNCSLSDDRNALKYVFPAGTSIAPGGFIARTGSALGFGLKAGGDTVYFRAPGAGGAPGRVLDALRFGPQSAGTTFGRYPDGAVNFFTLGAASSGAANSAPAPKPAVISEILYHPPPGSAQLPFVEVTNTSGVALDLAGWHLRGGISYDFPAGTTLAAGARVAVSNFSGSLKQSGERIRLEKPVVNVDGLVSETIYPIVDEVGYGTGGRWGRDSDGGGSSLELRDLRSDGRLASNWADSAESGEGDWVTLTNTGVLDNGLAGATPDRLEVLLLGAGEVLIDNVELVQGAGGNFVTNPGFENGMTGWSGTGTHAGSSVEATAGVGGSGAMHLRATGRGDLANRLVNVLGSTATTGATFTLRAQVKYLRGHPEILFRVHGGWLETTGNVLGPVHPGTPGAANSRAVAKAGPAISDVTHQPVLPVAGQTVFVYAKMQDPDGIATPVLNYRVDPATATTAVGMVARGAGIYSAELPAQSAGKLVAFSITATDGAGAASTFPADAPAAECLIRWGETQPAGNNLATYRLWLTQATTTNWATRLKNSNAPLDATFVCGDYRVIYNAGAMYSGSANHTPSYTSPTGTPCDYNVVVPPDDRYLGETDLLWVGPGSLGTDHSQIREQAAYWIARKIHGQSLHLRYVNVNVNGVRRGEVMLDMQQPNGEFVDEYFPGDNDGALHKCQDWIEYNDAGSAFTGTTIVRAVLAPFKSAGQYKTAAYRYRWSVRSVEDSANDFTALTNLVDAFNAGTSATDPAFFNALDPILDQDSWSRALAVQRIAGAWDSWGWSYGKNMYIYKPRNGPWTMVPWDLDITMGPDGSQSVNPPPDVPTAPLFTNTSNYDPASPGDPLATKYRTQPDFRRSYWRALLDAANGPMVPANFEARVDLMTNALLANGVPVNAAQVVVVKTYNTQRRDFILAQASTAFGGTTFALVGSSTINDADGVLTLTGTAPATVAAFRINGVIYTPTWTSETAWSLPLTLFAPTNNLTVQALDNFGAVVGTFPVTINVTGPPPVPPISINEWMADNPADSGIVDPADGKADDWFELHNHGATAVNLGGYFLTDTSTNKALSAIPAGTVIFAGGYLLVWADDEAFQNGIAPAGQIHAGFKLSADGEQIGLYTPDGTQVDLITFGAQAEGQSQGRYPDSAASIVAGAPTPGTRNALVPRSLGITDLGGNASRFSFTTEPTHTYQLEFCTVLGAWAPSGAPFVASGTTATLDLPRTGTRGFWRVRLIVP